MSKRKQPSVVLAIMALGVMLFSGALAPPAQAQRQGRFFEQEIRSGDAGDDFNTNHGHGDPINWTHSLSASDLAAANSGGVIVDAFDVDYPSSTEYDRLLINGRDYGLLEGRNGAWGSTEKSISLGDLRSGSNAFRVNPDEDPDPPPWILQIRQSTLYLYADEDFDISASPASQTAEPTDTTTYEVQTDWIGVWDNPVALSVSGLPTGAVAAFVPNPVTTDGGASTMTVTLTNVAAGSYPLTITGTGAANYPDSGGSRNVVHTTAVNLIVGEAGVEPPRGFQLITADPIYIEAEMGQTVESRILGHFIENCEGPIALTLLPRPESGRAVPNTVTLRLNATQLTPAKSSTLLEMVIGADTEAGEYTIEVEGSGCGLDDPGKATITLVIKPVNIAITKRQSQSTVMPNMVQIYTIAVKNNGQTEVTGVVVTDVLASTLSYVSDTATDADHAVVNGRHTWTFNRPLRPGGAFTFNINARVDPFIRSGISISNRAEAIADQAPEPVVSNTVTATSGFTAVEPEGLAVTKRALKRDARIGGILTYRIEVKNISQAGPIFDIVLKDRMPNGFKIPAGKTVRDGALFSDPVRSGRTYTWQLGNLGPGETTVITYQAVVGTNAASGRNENIATATGKDGGGNRVSGTDSALVMLGAGDMEELGQITVTAYKDRNFNGTRDASDTPMKGVTFILIPPGLKQTTGEDGKTVFTNIKAGQYVVAPDLKSIPNYLSQGDGAEKVRMIEGEHADLDFFITLESGMNIKVKVEKK
jgi:uncharacterized repeat protein (TIGR01451 family)/fimbrial isopeptide formation D2 family protein